MRVSAAAVVVSPLASAVVSIGVISRMLWVVEGPWLSSGTNVARGTDVDSGIVGDMVGCRCSIVVTWVACVVPGWVARCSAEVHGEEVEASTGSLSVPAGLWADVALARVVPSFAVDVGDVVVSGVGAGAGRVSLGCIRESLEVGVSMDGDGVGGVLWG